jgi:hypothetical protein
MTSFKSLGLHKALPGGSKKSGGGQWSLWTQSLADGFIKFDGGVPYVTDFSLRVMLVDE